jgi:hypothetical protein
LRIGAVLQQHAGRVRMAVVAGQHRQAVAAFLAQVGRQALTQQRREFAGIPGAREVEDLAHERQRVFVELAGRWRAGR